jgi:hypothetical protein
MRYRDGFYKYRITIVKEWKYSPGRRPTPTSSGVANQDAFRVVQNGSVVLDSSLLFFVNCAHRWIQPLSSPRSRYIVPRCATIFVCASFAFRFRRVVGTITTVVTWHNDRGT